MNTLSELFKTFEDRGDDTAFVYRTGVRRLTYSYTFLFEQSLKVSSWLEHNGINPGDKVILWAPNSPWWAISFWGIIARGAIVVPVDFMSDKKRAQGIFENSEAKAIIQSSNKLEKLEENIPSIFAEDFEYILKDIPMAKHVHERRPEDTAELIYTSGTTGTPKGVILSHLNLTTNLRQVVEHIPIIEGSWNFLSLLPLSHIFEQQAGFFIPLSKGATIAYLRTLKPSAILEALNHEDIYVLPTVPRILEILKSSIEQDLEKKHLGSVFTFLKKRAQNKSLEGRKKLFGIIHKKFGTNFKFFVSGGAALPIETAQFWSLIGFKVIEGYGITECSPVVSANTFDEQVFGTVGDVLPGIDVKIENNEILVRGDNVTKGYYKNEIATKQALTDGWYKTGDIGEKNDKGKLVIKGRRKEMIVTSGGINVYPDDIEPLLLGHAGVKDACIIGLDTGRGEEVHAVLILEDSAPSPEEILKETNQNLDSLQHISGYSLWPEDSFPKTTTLKVRKFLVKEKLSEVGSEIATSSTDTLIAFISKVTNTSVSEISDSTHLLDDLGLTSLGRIELVNLIEQEYRLDMDDSEITSTTTVWDIREKIRKREKKSFSWDHSMWMHSKGARALSKIFDTLVFKPLFGSLMKISITGQENLKNVKGPVIYASNHLSYFDAPAIYTVLGKRRYTLASPMLETIFKGRKKSTFIRRIRGKMFLGFLKLVGRTFQATQEGTFRGTLSYMGKLVDRGISILIFPEGARSSDGTQKEFQAGLSTMVQELKIPVIPIKISGTYEAWPRQSTLPKGLKSPVSISIGAPLEFEDMSTNGILKTTREALSSQ